MAKATGDQSEVGAAVGPPLSRAERKREELRREIVDASFSCFAEKGYHGTGISDIAARLGIGHGTFYRYFENKRDIVDHVITHLLERVVSALAAENAPDAPATLAAYREQTERIATALLSIMDEDPRIARLLLFQAPAIDAELEARVTGLIDAMAELTAGYLRHGVAVGYLPADLDTLNTARAINGMILAGAIHGLNDPGHDSGEYVVAALRLMHVGLGGSMSTHGSNN